MHQPFSSVHTFRRKPYQVQAILLAEHTLKDAAAWCGGRVGLETKPSDHSDNFGYVEYPTLDGPVKAAIGTYLIRGEDGKFFHQNQHIFETEMEHVTTRGDGPIFPKTSQRDRPFRGYEAEHG